MDATFVLRPIRPSDDPQVAAIVREVMTEHACDGAGFAIHDAEVAAMSRNYASAEARYFVIEHDGVVLGGGGFARLLGTTTGDATCELRKMYFRPELRGRGLGRKLLLLLLDEMRAAGYRHCYLETTTQMERARELYRSAGFVERCSALGSTGHHGCDRFFARDL